MTLEEHISKKWPEDNERQFIARMVSNFINKHESVKNYTSPTTYILAELSDLVESGKMNRSTAKGIVGKLVSTGKECEAWTGL
jgi:Asp-tRNA(Asn)/Glu-tRNA(Gln) amidotransferase B subunit